MDDGEYKILEEISASCNEVVYRALDIKHRREVAIKSDGDSHEYEVLSQLGHLDCIPKLYNYYESKDERYLVIELIKGETLLDEWLLNDDWDFIWMTLYHAIKILTDLHENGWCSGNAVQDNFMWCQNKLYIINFDTIRLLPNDDYDEVKQNIEDDFQSILNLKDIKSRCHKFSNMKHGKEKVMLLKAYQGIDLLKEYIHIDQSFN